MSDLLPEARAHLLRQGSFGARSATEQRQIRMASDEARARLAVLHRAEELGNVSAACREAGMSRPAYYGWRRRFDEHGISGLEDAERLYRFHPQALSDDTVAALLALSEVEPAWGAARLAAALRREGYTFSLQSAQKHLDRAGLGQLDQRLARLAEAWCQDRRPLSDTQLAAILRRNPAFRERHEPARRAGELLTQRSGTLARLPEGRALSVTLVVDGYSGYALGRADFGEAPWQDIKLLEETVLPFFRTRDIGIAQLLVHLPENRHQDGNLLRQRVQAAGVCLLPATRRAVAANGHIAQVWQSLKAGWLPEVLARNGSLADARVPDRLADWLAFYNTLPQAGYPNFGRAPASRLRPSPSAGA